MSSSIEVRPIGSQGLKAGSLGFGAMGLTAFYGAPLEDEDSVGNEINLSHKVFSLRNNTIFQILH